MPGTGFTWHPVGLARFGASQVSALRHCLGVVRAFRPDVVVGFGGFTSAPAAIAGRMRGIPVALHEANRVPGLAIRSLGRLAGRVYLPLGIRIPGVRAAATRHAGLPVRREIVRVPAAPARQALGLDPSQKTVVVLGGEPLGGRRRDQRALEPVDRLRSAVGPHHLPTMNSSCAAMLRVKPSL